MSTESEGPPHQRRARASELTPCPCGKDAVWHRVVLFPYLNPCKPAEQAVTVMRAPPTFMKTFAMSASARQSRLMSAKAGSGF